jgi:hypothetical protein
MKGPPPDALCSRLCARLRLAPFCLHCHLCAYRCSFSVDLRTHCPREGAVLSHAPFILVHTSSRICRLLACTGTCPALRACSVAPCTPTPWVPCGVRLCVVYARAECAAGGLAACAWYRIRYSHALFISLSYYRAKPCTAMPPGSECDGSGGYPGSSHSWLGLVVRGGSRRTLSMCFKNFKGKIWKIQL